MARKLCLVCGKDFYAKPRDIVRGYAKYCSKGCYDTWQKKSGYHVGKNSPRWNSLQKECKYCGKKVFVSPSRWADGRGRYCSRTCYAKDMVTTKRGTKMSKEARLKISGENHYNWKGGRSLINRKRLKNAEWDAIKKEVYARDKRICQMCGNYCEWRDISCHHIIPWRICKSDEAKNLITLCRSCHAKADLLGHSVDQSEGIIPSPSG